MEKLLERLEICLQVIANAKQDIDNDKPIEDLRKLVDELIPFTYTFESDLFILTQLASGFYSKNKDLVSRNMCLFDCKKLVRKYKLDHLIFNIWSENLNSLPEHEKQSALLFEYEYSPRHFMVHRWEQYGIRKVDKKKLTGALQRILSDACQVIDIHLFHDYELEDENAIRDREMHSYWDETHRETTFYEDFINEKATLEEWKQFPNTGFRNYFEYHGSGTDEGWNKVNGHQHKLFMQALREEIDILKGELFSLPEPYLQDNAATQLAIIRKFLSGEFSQLDYKRLNKIIEFTDPDEVILELDDMSRYDVYNYDKYLPYNGENNKKSPRFVATLLIEYKEMLVRVVGPEISRKSVMIGLEDVVYENKPKLPKPSAFKLK
jgi:hypothetical protein